MKTLLRRSPQIYIIISFFVIGLVIVGLNGWLHSGAVSVGDCRFPQTCLQCHEQELIDEEQEEGEIACDLGAFSDATQMNTARFLHSVAILNDGRVFLTGGMRAGAIAQTSAEIYDPETNTFTLTTGSMSIRRISHVATALQDGRVLVTGGRTATTIAGGGVVLSSAEIYDPATDTFTSTGNMNVARRSHTATLLSDGRVLIAGGGSGVSTGTTLPIASCEIYDPQTGVFTLAGNMNFARQFQRAVVLKDGRILLANGSTGAGTSAPTKKMEIYDPQANTFTYIGDSIYPRLAQGAVRMRDGRVLLIASYTGVSGGISPSCEIYDPQTNTFTATGSMHHPRIDIGGFLLPSGKVLVPAGAMTVLGAAVFHPTAEIFDPETEEWKFVGSLNLGRDEFSGVLLKDGRAFISGGFGKNVSYLQGAEIYTSSPQEQARGIIARIEDLPASAITDSDRRTLISKVEATLGMIQNGEAYPKDKDQQILYMAEGNKLENDVLKKMNGCAGGNTSDDRIIGCENQEQVYPLVKLLIDTLTNPNIPPTSVPGADVTSGTKPLTVNFTGSGIDTDGTITSYNWDFGDGTGSVLQNPTKTYNFGGTYTVTLTVVDDDGATGTATLTIDVTNPGTVSYANEVQRTFNNRCTGCHGNDGGLTLTSRATLLAGGNSGPAVIPGDADASLLVCRIEGSTCGQMMPKGSDPLTSTQITLIRNWINQGALNN
ncbi:MAG: hypothetical protein A2149_06690 [Candidatus Schekmanbacteria bacterium RBG_16_38_11]|uniref:PKD domain-containing protein n=1 Tax=Candidatus Schekmanbacteria bacterium RBG_16_38_11 TaxID=1817880 RepID=A0A1F7RTJ6_9BACT|nr:MAG: hypothetical protein A2149_06690 [Candidatus Schekmanbacteria bacterium RBG_16_38_11]